MGGFRKGRSCNSRLVLKPEVAIAGDVSNSGKNSLAITDFFAKKTQHVQLFEKPLPGTPPCTWVKTGRFGSFFVLCFLALGGHCLQMLCLPGFGTHANIQNLPHFRAFPASIQEHSPPKCLFSWQTLNCQIVPVLHSYNPPPSRFPRIGLTRYRRVHQDYTHS